MWTDGDRWAVVLARVLEESHLVSGDQLSHVVDGAVCQVGMTADVLIVDLAQQVLTAVRPSSTPRHAVTGSPAGQAYQLGEIVADEDESGGRQLWVPMLDGTDRVGVLRFGLGDVVDDAELRHWAWALSSLMGHITVTKLAHSDSLRRRRGNGPLSAASELLWQLLPPRTFATRGVVVSAILAPHDRVAGDAYDYNIDGTMLDLAVFDGVGHDLGAGLMTTLAITAIRNARRSGETDLLALTEHADRLVVEQQRRPAQFVTALLARLDTSTGLLEYLLAGHPPPLLVRRDRVVKALESRPRPPIGIVARGREPALVAREQLQPGDRLLLYSDGITEARDHAGEFFGEHRLVEFTERAAGADLSAPEILRRLVDAVLAHQGGELQDDATMLMVDWSADGHRKMLPRLG